MKYRSLVRVTEPTVDPISLDQAKAHLRIDSNDEDALITSLITTASRWAEDYCDRTWILTQWKMSVDSFYGNVGSPVQFGLKSDGNNIAGRQSVVPNLDLELPRPPARFCWHGHRYHDHVYADRRWQHDHARCVPVSRGPAVHSWGGATAVRAKLAGAPA